MTLCIRQNEAKSKTSICSFFIRVELKAQELKFSNFTKKYGKVGKI